MHVLQADRKGCRGKSLMFLKGSYYIKLDTSTFFPKLSERQVMRLQHDIFTLRCKRSFISFLSVSENVFTCQIFHIRENPDCGLKSFSCHVSN